MDTPSKPTSPTPPQPTPPSSPTTEEELEIVPADKFLTVLKWKESDFQTLMMKIRMLEAYGAMFPQEVGDTAGDAPVGYVTMFADFFGICNLRLLLTVFMVDLLEYYKIHIFQLRPLGTVRARHFEYCIRSQNLEPLVKDFRRFYQLHVQLAFFFVLSAENRPQDYVVAAQGFDQVVPLKALGNKELQYLRMMLRNKPGVRTKLVVRENYQGNLGALGDPTGKGVPTGPVVIVVDKKKKKPENPITISVKQGASDTYHRRFCKSEDYVIVSDTLEGLGVLGSCSGAGGTTVGTWLFVGKKRNGDTAAASETKRPNLRRTRATVLNTRMHVVSIGKFFHTKENFYVRIFPDMFVC
ncbi:hypothetical protein HanPI659440_Chr03g0101581 [Helianthus annuus]|nr:hypothetical protein HanPI659440_Chr03g0101581 [Helianthus annuus]